MWMVLCEGIRWCDGARGCDVAVVVYQVGTSSEIKGK